MYFGAYENLNPNKTIHSRMNLNRTSPNRMNPSRMSQRRMIITISRVITIITSRVTIISKLLLKHQNSIR